MGTHFKVHLKKYQGLIGLVLLGFMFWGARSLWDSSEARYGQVAFEMLTSGNWLVPTLAGQPHLTKPPFSYWMIAAGMKLFGINAWGARFFLSVFFTGTLLCVRELARTMGYNPREALAAAFIFGTSLVPFAGGHVLTTDMFLTFWETLGILAAWKVWQAPRQGIRLWRLTFWAAFGMGFFTKGPPAWLPLMAVALFLWVRRHDGTRPSLLSLPGISLFLGLSGWWFVLLVARDPSLLHYFIGDEVVGRIASTMHHRNHPFWMYAPVLLFGAGPWMVLWPALAAKAYAGVRAKTFFQHDHKLFLLLWFLIPLGVFLLSRSRMPLYVLPLFVPLSILMGGIWCRDICPRLQVSPFKQRAFVSLISLWVLVLILFSVYPDHFPGSRSRRPAARVFATALARIKEPCTLYWAYAGHQKYSIPFYLQRVIMDAEKFDRHPTGKSTAPQSESGRHVLYITKSHLLPKLMEKTIPPVVKARTEKYALIEWPAIKTTARHSVPANANAVNRWPPHRAVSQREWVAALLLILAQSHH